MNKVIKLFTLFVFSMLISIKSVYAYGFDISVTSNSITEGNSATLNIKVTDAAGKFTILSSNSSVVSISNNSLWIDNTTQGIILKANKEGTAQITIIADDVTSYSNNSVTGSKSINITVKPKQTIQNNNNTNNNKIVNTPKSSNNYLSSLTIEGYKINEDFDKEVLEYSVEIPAETEKIKINAQLADSNSKVTGTGEVSVTTGTNNFEIVVTAENGSKRTYKLKATVLELEPIVLTINQNKYIVVRKYQDLPKISEYYTKKNVKIQDNDVDGYYNETLDYTLVGLKDESGSVDYYIYKNNKYTKYKEYVFNGTTLQITDKEISGNYKETEFKYDKDVIKAYQEYKLDIIKNTYALETEEIAGNQFYLFYAINVENGKENLYQYDAVEKTIQRYNTEILSMYKDASTKYYICLIASILVILILFIVNISLIISKHKLKKKDRYNKKKKKIEFDEL